MNPSGNWVYVAKVLSMSLLQHYFHRIGSINLVLDNVGKYRENLMFLWIQPFFSACNVFHNAKECDVHFLDCGNLQQKVIICLESGG